MIEKFIKQISDRIFSTRAAGLYILLFAFFIGLATFIENDYGTNTAQKIIFKSWWFELLLLLFAVSIVMNIIRFRMIQNRRWALFTFHASMIIILIGAAVTRYAGYEGMMHIREGDSSNVFLSRENYLNFEIQKDNNNYKFDEPVLFGSLGKNSFDQEYALGSDLIKVRLLDYIPNPKQELVEVEDGIALLKIVFGSSQGRQEYWLGQGSVRRFNGVTFNFSSEPMPSAVNIFFENNTLSILPPDPMTVTVMATQERDTIYPNDGKSMLRLRSLYSDGVNSFVFGDFNPSAELVLESESIKIKSESLEAVQLAIQVNDKEQTTTVYGRMGMEGRPQVLRFDELDLAISYGAKERQLPFSIKLYDFIMERYPGTNSAASYASEVQLIDARKGVKRDFRIYMNHILNYGGYRFFQSSFDRDERGTYLSVNHDFWGTWISYLGYFLLTLGMILMFFSPKSRFSFVRNQLKKNVVSSTGIWVLVMLCFSASDISAQKKIELRVDAVSKSHADLFSKVIVQDFKGRMKPTHTLSRELLRKVSRKESMFGLNADQIVLSMFGNKQDWISKPLIKSSKSSQIQELLGSSHSHVSYKDFFNIDGSYKLRDAVRIAYSMNSADRTSYEKDLLKIDERLNIVSMIFSGRIFNIVPVPNDPNNKWVSSMSDDHGSDISHDPVAERFFNGYRTALHDALHSGDYSYCDQVVNDLRLYQAEIGAKVMPSTGKVSTEIALNNLNVFGRLSPYYLLLGMAFLLMLFVNVFKPELNLAKFYKVLLAFVFLGFLFHTLGLGMRWYVSGRAPWSNGYESMIYIAWTSALAGIIFTRKSYGGLSATMVLAGTILLVAKLSYLDPEITPLVPVLRSYWLTIHVSLIAGSYGFLMLGALIGLFNLILFVFLNDENKLRVKRQVKELSYISEITLIGGLIMISIGTYLGGVWANESWGRYWGWDAKETWALVTILVYAFILHMRIIPKLNGLYIYNLAKLFGWASVIMTYFGVNYYLSGLHSYAAGDPIPIPNWVYISVAACAIISVLAWIQYKRYGVRKL